MLKDHTKAREETHSHYNLAYSFRSAASEFFYMHHPTDRIVHAMAFVTPVVESWLEQEIAQWVHHEESIQ